MAIPTPTFQLGGSAGWGTKAGKLLAQSQYLGSNGNNLYKPVSIDATRNSGGWRINKDGLWERRNDNVPRITFENNANGALLSEDSAVNLISSPTDFTTDWVTNGATVDSNVAIAPDGTMTADRINLINNTGAKIEQQINYSSGINLSAGVWLKSESGNVTIRWSGGAGSLEAITVTEEWQRFERTDATGVGTTGFPQLRNSDPSAVKSVLAWGFTSEENDFVTSPILEATTRNADSIGGVIGSDFIGQSEGTFYAEIKAFTDQGGSDGRRSISLHNGTNDFVRIRYGSADRIEFEVTVGGVQQCSIIEGGAVDILNSNKVAGRYAENNFALWINGTQIGSTDTSGIVFTSTLLNQLNFAWGTSSQPFYGECAGLAHWNTALTDAQMAELTTNGI